MSDLISRQDAVDAVYYYIESGYKCDIFKELKNLPSVEPQRKWIPVTEALPKMKEVVLITNGKGHVRCGKYQGIFDNKN